MNYDTYRLTLNYYRRSSCMYTYSFQDLKKLKAVRRFEVSCKKKKEERKKDKGKNNSDYLIILKIDNKDLKRVNIKIINV